MLTDLLVELGILDSDGGLIRQGAQELAVLLTELVRCPAIHVEHANDHVVGLQRHCHSGTQARFLGNRQEGTINIFLLVVAHYQWLTSRGHTSPKPFPCSD